MRCYNGCPDSELKAVLDSQAKAHARARELGYRITWFPVEERYAAARLSDWAEVGPFCHTVEQCLVHVEEHAKETA